MKSLNAKMTFEERSTHSGMKNVHRIGKDSARAKKVQCIETGQIFDTIIDEYWKLSLTKIFNNIKEPDSTVTINYEVD